MKLMGDRGIKPGCAVKMRRETPLKVGMIPIVVLVMSLGLAGCQEEEDDASSDDAVEEIEADDED